MIAALLLLASMLLPWYQETGFAIVAAGQSRIDDSKNAFQVYSFVEAAIFLVAAGVLVLMFARGQRKAFHLPGGDGTVVMAAGLWVMLLVFYRQLDKPDGRDGPISTSIGVSWGIFIAFLLGALLAYAGYRIRAAHVPEPDLDIAGPPPPPEPPTRPMRRKSAAPSEPPTTVAACSPSRVLEADAEPPMSPPALPRSASCSSHGPGEVPSTTRRRTPPPGRAASPPGGPNSGIEQGGARACGGRGGLTYRPNVKSRALRRDASHVEPVRAAQRAPGDPIGDALHVEPPRRSGRLFLHAAVTGRGAPPRAAAQRAAGYRRAATDRSSATSASVMPGSPVPCPASSTTTGPRRRAMPGPASRRRRAAR